jgi:hypothetical protein
MARWVYVPAPPGSSVTVTAGDEHRARCQVNVHAKSRLIPETQWDTPVRNQGPGQSLPGPDAGHPLHGAGGHEDATVAYDRRRRAGCLPDRPVNAGNSRSLPDSPPRRPHLRTGRLARCANRPSKQRVRTSGGVAATVADAPTNRG